MSKILVSGLLTLETTAKIRGFPINYYPIDFDFFGVNSTLSGVAFNLAKALTTLGDTVDLTSLWGQREATQGLLLPLCFPAAQALGAGSHSLVAFSDSAVLFP